jgi:hypothetical protein
LSSSSVEDVEEIRLTTPIPASPIDFTTPLEDVADNTAAMTVTDSAVEAEDTRQTPRAQKTAAVAQRLREDQGKRRTAESEESSEEDEEDLGEPCSKIRKL